MQGLVDDVCLLGFFQDLVLFFFFKARLLLTNAEYVYRYIISTPEDMKIELGSSQCTVPCQEAIDINQNTGGSI